MIQDKYYSDNAFDSTKLVTQKPAPEKQTFAQESAESHALVGKGIQCGEYAAIQDMRAVEFLNDMSPDAIADRELLGQEYIEWSGYKNPRVKVYFITWFAGFLLFASIPSSIFLLFLNGFDSDSFKFMFIVIIIPYLIYKLGKTALRKNWVKDKHNTELNRKTGRVTFTWSKERVSYPFIEFDTSMQSVVDRTGIVNYHLILMHRYTGHFCREPGGEYDKWKVELYWEEIQHFMDISKPLPDIPRLECFRQNDPVTKVWDEQHHRPTDYWKNIKDEKIANKIKSRSEQHAQYFPFGQSRDEAQILGWEESGVAEGDWQNKPRAVLE